MPTLALMSPHTAFFLLQGLETLPLSMQRHVENTRNVVAFLVAHPQVQSVAYPELESHPDHALAKHLLPRGCGAVFSFAIKGTRAQGRKLSSRSACSRICQRRRRQVAVDPPRVGAHSLVPDADLAAPASARNDPLSSAEDIADLLDDLDRREPPAKTR